MTTDARPKPKAWYTVDDIASLLHVSRRQVQRLVRPHDARCHLARAGRAPRLLKWVPREVVMELVEQRAWYATGRSGTTKI